MRERRKASRLKCKTLDLPQMLHIERKCHGSHSNGAWQIMVLRLLRVARMAMDGFQTFLCIQSISLATVGIPFADKRPRRASVDIRTPLIFPARYRTESTQLIASLRSPNCC